MLQKTFEWIYSHHAGMPIVVLLPLFIFFINWVLKGITGNKRKGVVNPVTGSWKDVCPRSTFGGNRFADVERKFFL